MVSRIKWITPHTKCLSSIFIYHFSCPQKTSINFQTNWSKTPLKSKGKTQHIPAHPRFPDKKFLHGKGVLEIIQYRVYVEQYRLIQTLCGGTGVTDITDVTDITSQKLQFSHLPNQHRTTWAVTSQAPWADCFWECTCYPFELQGESKTWPNLAKHCQAISSLQSRYKTDQCVIYGAIQVEKVQIIWPFYSIEIIMGPCEVLVCPQLRRTGPGHNRLDHEAATEQWCVNPGLSNPNPDPKPVTVTPNLGEWERFWLFSLFCFFVAFWHK